MAKVAVLVIIALVVLWAVLKGNQKPVVVETPTQATPAAAVKAVPISLKIFEQNRSGEFGVVDISPVGAKTRIVITMTGKKISEAQPVHLHKGMCPKPDEIKYALNDVVNGISDTTLDAPMDTVLSEPQMAVNVHKSVADASSYVACGDVGR